MMIKTILHYAPVEDMGDTTEEEAEKFRNWARAELARKFPGAEIHVNAVTGLENVAVADDGDLDTEEEALDFVSRLWDRCPWDELGD
jgi:hypothetical protein